MGEYEAAQQIVEDNLDPKTLMSALRKARARVLMKWGYFDEAAEIIALLLQGVTLE